MGSSNAWQARRPRACRLHLLDEAVAHEVLAPWYPALEATVKIDRAGVERLLHALRLGHAPIANYRALESGGVLEDTDPATLRDLLLRLSAETGGADVGVQILSMRLYLDEYHGHAHAPELIVAGRELLAKVKFAGRDIREDYSIGQVVKACLHGEEGAAVSREIFAKLRKAIATYETSAGYHDDLLLELFRVQPILALDALCGGDLEDLERGTRILREVAHLRNNPIDVVTTEDLLLWCSAEPALRYPAIARVIRISHDTNSPSEWSTTALRILDEAPDRIAVLRAYITQFGSLWPGPQIAKTEAHVKLLDQLQGYPDSSLAAFAEQEAIRLREAIDEERRAETATDRQRDERFE